MHVIASHAHADTQATAPSLHDSSEIRVASCPRRRCRCCSQAASDTSSSLARASSLRGSFVKRADGLCRDDTAKVYRTVTPSAGSDDRLPGADVEGLLPGTAMPAP